MNPADPRWEGCLSLDRGPRRGAGQLELEPADDCDITQGACYVSVILQGQRGQVPLTRSAVRLVQPDHRVVIDAYAELEPVEVTSHSPRVVLLGNDNRINAVHATRVTLP